MAKPIITVKIGSRSSSLVRLWREYREGDTEVYAMDANLYNELHWSFRRKKSCQYWKRYTIWKVTPDGSFLYLSH